MRWSQKVTCCPKHRIHVSCTCGVPEVKGQPCIHSAKHALAMGKDVSSLFHYKDTSAAWKEQYDQNVESPGISFAEAQANGYADEKARYPPVAPPKVGRPKKNKRIQGHHEKKATSKRKCGGCGGQGHTKRSRECPNFGGGGGGGGGDGQGDGGGGSSSQMSRIL